MGQIMTYIVMLICEIVFCCWMIQMSGGNQITGNAFVRRRGDNRSHIQHHDAEHDERQENSLGREIEELSHH
ncbi:MAG: hypothetical protein CMM61_05820 [Rhodospirillaceae bacterium]|nr:hypothetical protein [Rhodospirillaceae bacterium]